MAINQRKQQFNIFEELESDTKGFLKNMKSDIVKSFRELFENNIDIFLNRKLFDRNLIKKLIEARDEADPALIEDLEKKVDPNVKVETILSITD